MNDKDRARWIRANEGLWRWWRSDYHAKGTMLGAFIVAHRAEIDRIIDHLTTAAFVFVAVVGYVLAAHELLGVKTH